MLAVLQMSSRFLLAHYWLDEVNAYWMRSKGNKLCNLPGGFPVAVVPRLGLSSLATPSRRRGGSAPF
jgi:hypothetical protein